VQTEFNMVRVIAKKKHEARRQWRRLALRATFLNAEQAQADTATMLAESDRNYNQQYVSRYYRKPSRLGYQFFHSFQVSTHGDDTTLVVFRVYGVRQMLCPAQLEWLANFVHHHARPLLAPGRPTRAGIYSTSDLAYRLWLPVTRQTNRPDWCSEPQVLRLTWLVMTLLKEFTDLQWPVKLRTGVGM
jgi:hypothetical protein